MTSPPPHWTFALCLLLALALPACADVPASAATQAPTAVADVVAPLTATPAPTQALLGRPIYVLDPADQGTLSHVFMIDPRRPRIVWSITTRFLPEAAVSPDGRRLYVVDSYRSQVTRGAVHDVLSVYDAQTGELLVDDQPVPGRLYYKAWPSAQHPFTFLSDDGSVLYVGKYGEPINGPARLAAYDANTLELLYEGLMPECSLRLQTLPDRWTCAGVRPASTSDPGAAALRLNFFDPRTGQLLESRRLAPEGTATCCATAAPAGSRLFVLDGDGAVTVVDAQGRQVVASGAIEVPPGWQVDRALASSDGRRLVVGFDTGADENSVFTDAIGVYDTQGWARLALFNLPGWMNDFALSALGDQLYVLDPFARRLSIYDMRTFQQTGVLDELGEQPMLILVP